MSKGHLRRKFSPPNLAVDPHTGEVIDPSLPIIPPFLPNKLSGSPTHGDPSGKVVLLDPNKTEQLAVQLDTKGYNLSDQDFARRFPDLVAGREQNITDSSGEVVGGPSRAIAGSLEQSGLGDVNFGQGEYVKARNMGLPITSIEQRDRTYFQRLMADNPHRSFGLNSNDIAKIAISNTGMQNANQQAQYGSRLNQYLSASQQASSNQAALISGGGSLVGAGIKAYANDPYLSNQGYRDYNAAASSTPAGSTVGYNSSGAAGYYSNDPAAYQNGGTGFTEASSSGGI